MDFTSTSHYGVWGFGVVGNSLVRFLLKHNKTVSVFDDRTLTQEEQAWLSQRHVRYYPPEARADFFKDHTHICLSPGVPLMQQQGISYIHELDLFNERWHKPLIAITGSLGKTSLVHSLDTVATTQGKRMATGGNIGRPLLDLLDQQNTADYGLVELSSFQLEHARPLNPAISVITNLFKNHLDRHGSFTAYCEAKERIFRAQNHDQHLIVPIALQESVRRHGRLNGIYIATDSAARHHLHEHETLYTFENNHVVRYACGDRSDRGTPAQLGLLPQSTLMLYALVDVLNIPARADTAALEHRLERVGTYHGITWYNDSKSTVFEATLAAVTALAPAPIHLLLGGVSKGVDRVSRVKELAPHVASVHCFGAEAEELSRACMEARIPTTTQANLEQAVTSALEAAKKNDLLVLSPAGASFDLYTDYKERGKHFKHLAAKNI